jgi:hypothetical protein
MNRPNPFEGDPLRGWRARGERGILRWLETQGYEHAVLADEDMHREPAILQSYTTVILNAHPEYYSDNMRRALQEFLDAGGNLAYLGGNGVYWRITVADRQLECRKEMDITARLHTQPEVSGTLGGRWRELGQPESALLGIEFDVEWYLATHGRQYTPYVVKQPDHFAFANTNLQEGDLFGTPGRTLWGDDADGASGYEIDRVTEHSPDNIVVLAEATGEPAAAQMTYYDHPGGGGVFSAGSISFTMGIDLDDDRLGAVLRNVLDRFVADTGP